MTLDILDVDVRTQNCLRAAKIDSLEKLVSLTEADILKLHNFGRVSFERLKSEMARHGLSFHVKNAADYAAETVKWHERRVRNAEAALRDEQAKLDNAKRKLEQLLAG